MTNSPSELFDRYHRTDLAGSLRALCRQGERSEPGARLVGQLKGAAVFAPLTGEFTTDIVVGAFEATVRPTPR